jgi:hypothetical protein
VTADISSHIITATSTGCCIVHVEHRAAFVGAAAAALQVYTLLHNNYVEDDDAMFR